MSKKSFIAIIIIFILAFGILFLASGGFKTQSRRIDATGNGMDWDVVNSTSTNTHVYYAQGDDYCYSDGSWASNLQYDYWLSKYERKHN